MGGELTLGGEGEYSRLLGDGECLGLGTGEDLMVGTLGGVGFRAGGGVGVWWRRGEGCGVNTGGSSIISILRTGGPS